MIKSLKTSAIAGLGLTLLMGAGAVYAASPVANFGPPISGDKTLDANLGVLTQTLAWLNSPEGDVYQLALSIPAPEMPFENVAMESASLDILAANTSVHNDQSLNGSLNALAQVIAWQKSPEGDAFQYALLDHVKGADFQRVALASLPPGVGFDANF